MSKAIAFRVDCVPPTATAQQKGAFVAGGRVRFFTKAKVRRTESLLAALLAPHAPAEPFDEAVAVRVDWTFPYRASERKAVVKAGLDVPHDRRPDLDNLGKALLDVMTSLGFWSDDGRIALLTTSKAWGRKPGIAVRIEPLTAADGGEAIAKTPLRTACAPARACAREAGALAAIGEEVQTSARVP